MQKWVTVEKTTKKLCWKGPACNCSVCIAFAKFTKKKYFLTFHFIIHICNVLVVFKSEHITSSIFHASHLFISLQWKLYHGTEKQP